MDLSTLRQEYTRAGLTRELLNPCPIQQFSQWFTQARTMQLPEPNAMGVATVSADGQPNVRTVLLKYFDDQGFVFFTNYSSNKAQEIAANPKVALSFLWLGLERQVIIRGTADRISQAESMQYFLSRPYGSQLGAWASNQSRVITNRQALEAKFNEMQRRFQPGEVPLPNFWGGIRVRPQSIEFWQGRPSRLHDRFTYTLQADSSWKIDRLAP